MYTELQLTIIKSSITPRLSLLRVLKQKHSLLKQATTASPTSGHNGPIVYLANPAVIRQCGGPFAVPYSSSK